MIARGARLTIQRVPIAQIQVWEVQRRNPARVAHYYRLLVLHPDQDPGLVAVMPSTVNPGLYALLDGHHRLLAAILAGRGDLLCVVIDEAPPSCYNEISPERGDGRTS